MNTQFLWQKWKKMKEEMGKVDMQENLNEYAFLSSNNIVKY